VEKKTAVERENPTIEFDTRNSWNVVCVLSELRSICVYSYPYSQSKNIYLKTYRPRYMKLAQQPANVLLSDVSLGVAFPDTASCVAESRA
jgi:hypothetical protein